MLHSFWATLYRCIVSCFRAGDPSIAPATISPTKRVRVKVMIGFLVRGRVRIKISIRIRVRVGVGVTFNVSNCRRSKCKHSERDDSLT